MKEEPQDTPIRILALVADSPSRTSLVIPLQDEGFELTFCRSTQEAFTKVPRLQPQLLLHDWAAVEETQAIAFHQRIQGVDEFASLCRLIIAPELSPRLIALAIDCSIRRVLTEATARIGIVGEVKMAMAAEDHLSALQKRVREMKRHPRSYDQDELDRLVEETYSRFSHDPAVKLEFGHLCLRRENFEQGLNIANGVLGKEPHNVRAMNLIARIHMKKGRFDEGIEILERANALSPKNPERLAELGNAFLLQGNHAAAKKHLVEAIEVDPRNAEAAAGLGQICLSEEEAHSVIELFQNSLSEEELVGFFNNAAIHSVRTTRYDDALKLYDMAMGASLTPGLKCSVQFNIGLAYRRMGMLEDAQRAFEGCLRIDDGFSKAQKHKKEVERQLGVKPGRRRG